MVQEEMPPVGHAIPIRPKPEPEKVFIARQLEADGIVRTEFGSWVGLKDDYVIFMNNRVFQVMNPDLFKEWYIPAGGPQ